TEVPATSPGTYRTAGPPRLRPMRSRRASGRAKMSKRTAGIPDRAGAVPEWRHQVRSPLGRQSWIDRSCYDAFGARGIPGVHLPGEFFPIPVRHGLPGKQETICPTAHRTTGRRAGTMEAHSPQVFDKRFGIDPIRKREAFNRPAEDLLEVFCVADDLLLLLLKRQMRQDGMGDRMRTHLDKTGR